MSKKISKILILSGIALILVGCGFYAYNQIEDYRAGQRSQQLLEQMIAEYDLVLPGYTAPNQNSPAVSADPVRQGEASPAGAAGTVASAYEERPDYAEIPVYARENDDAESTGGGGSTSGGGSSNRPAAQPVSYSTVGIIYIPKLNVRLPVMSECTDALLNISACRLSGLVNDKPNRLVIAGHNLKSHFKGLDTLNIGDEVTFTTLAGVTYRYSVSEVAALHKSQGAEVHAIDGWDISLLTCKSDRTMRTMVRCVEIVETPAVADTEEPAEEPVEEPAEEPAEAVVEEPAGVAVEQPAEQPVEAVTADQSGIASEEPAEGP